jgi:PAS domain S-box-containing protein
MSGRSTDTETPPIPEDPELLSQLTEYAKDALWMFTPGFEELVFVNSAYEDIFGQSVETLEENPAAFLEATHPDDVPRVMETMEQFSSGESVDVEFRVDPETDYDTWVWVQGEPVYDDAGDLAYLAGYTRDISERKETERALQQHREDLERSNESLREFAYIASHDLQEPLRMVSSYVDLLEMEYSDNFDEEAEEYMEFAVDGAQRMKRMINSLLEYSRVHTEANAFEQTDAQAVFEATRQDLELLIDETDAEVSAGDLPTIRTDPNQLGQVFQNLIKNAIHHTDDETEPRIEVTATERDEDYAFRVSDNGVGVPEGEQDDIFKIFTTGASASDSDSTGIGLAITQRIIQRHGGEIWVDSDADAGATFTFTIPKSAGGPDEGSSPV